MSRMSELDIEDTQLLAGQLAGVYASVVLDHAGRGFADEAWFRVAERAKELI